MKARQINDTIRYTMWSVFQQNGALTEAPEEVAADGAERGGGGDRGR